MKRPTTRRVRITWIRTATSLLACCLVLGGTSAKAQPPLPSELPHFANPPAAYSPYEAGAPVIHNAGGPGAAPANEAISTAAFVRKSGELGGSIHTVGQTTRYRDRPDEHFDFTVATELPGPEHFFRRESEAQFFERIRQESKGPPGSSRIIFPEEQPLTRDAYQPRCFPRITHLVEPANVCHGRLLFEQPNFERAGWDFGILTPGLNVAKYYYDLALLPYHMWTRPFEQTDCSAGKTLPGDTTPFYLYCEKFSVSGLAAEAAVVTGLFFLFP